MKIEKVSENQIQVTLNHSDLLDRDIKISELAYGSKSAQALFKDVMTKAYEDFGFETENVPLMIEAVPLSADSIRIVVTKVEDPSQIEQKLDEVGERPTHRTFKSPEEDRMTDLALMGQSNNTEATSDNKKYQFVKTITYVFGEFDNVCMAAHRVKPMFIGNSSLFKYNEKYFLILDKNENLGIKKNSIVSVLDEFGTKFIPTDLNEMFLKEHGKTMISPNAVEILAKYL